MLFPLFLILIWRLTQRKRWIVGAIIFIGIFSLLLSQWGSHHKPSATFFLLYTRAWELMIGALVALFLLYGKSNNELVNNNKLIGELLGVFGFLLICYSAVFFDENLPFPSIYTLVPTIGAALIILFTSSNTKLGKLLGLQGVVGVGLISYSAYLWHQPLFVFSRYKFGIDLGWLVVLFLILLSFSFAYISWRYIEKPFRDKVIVSRKKIILFSATGTAIFIFIGLLGRALDGKSPFMNPGVLNRAELVRLNNKDRLIGIKSGICHFNGRGLYEDFDAFHKNWSCSLVNENAYPQAKIGVFGDSHSADKAVALKQNGFDVTQLGGAGCPLTPSNITAKKPYCKDIFTKFSEIKGIDTVIISNSFGDEELTIASITEVIQYWSYRYKKVILFSPMPAFFNDTFLNYIRFGSISNKPSFKDHNMFYESIKHIEMPKNVIIVNTKLLLCGEGSVCEALHGDNLVFANKDHLTVYGARLFGKRLIDSPYCVKLHRKVTHHLH